MVRNCQIWNNLEGIMEKGKGGKGEKGKSGKGKSGKSEIWKMVK
jgi:hypothetical protein